MLTKELDTISEPMLARWRDYYALTKPGVVKLLVFTAIVGMFLATPGMVPWETLLFASLGIGLSAASGAAELPKNGVVHPAQIPTPITNTATPTNNNARGFFIFESSRT